MVVLLEDLGGPVPDLALHGIDILPGGTGIFRERIEPV